MCGVWSCTALLAKGFGRGKGCRVSALIFVSASWFSLERFDRTHNSRRWGREGTSLLMDLYGNVTDLGLSTKLGSLRENNFSHFAVYSLGFVPFSGEEETFHFRVKLNAKIDVWLVTHFWILLLPASLTFAWQRSSVCHLPPLQSSLHKELARGHRPATLGDYEFTDCSQKLQFETLLCILAEHPPPANFLSFVLEDKSATVKLEVFYLADCR